MKVRTGHVDLEEGTNVNLLFANAAALRCAWITGTGAEGHDLETAASEHGYTLGDLEDGDAWVAVRSDFITDDDLENGKDGLTFTNAVVGQVHLGVARDEFATEAELEFQETDSSKVLEITRYRVSPLRS